MVNFSANTKFTFHVSFGNNMGFNVISDYTKTAYTVFRRQYKNRPTISFRQPLFTLQT